MAARETKSKPPTVTKKSENLNSQEPVKMSKFIHSLAELKPLKQVSIEKQMSLEKQMII